MATALLPKPKKNPLLGDPNENPFRRPPELAETPTDRQPPSGYGYGAPGQDNARALLASRNIAVGRSAQAANPGAQKMRWRDIAAEAGIEDFKGAKRDPRFRALQDAFYGHADFGGVEDPERAGYKRAMAKGIIGGAGWQGSGGGAGGAGGAGGYGGAPVNFEGSLQSFITDVLGGKQGPYTDEAVSNLKAGAYDEFAGGLTAANRAAANRARRTGNLYSASTGSALRENEQGARQALGKQFRDVDTTAIRENFGARMGALSQGLQKLQSDRDLAIANARNATDRERIAKEYDAAITTTREKIASEEKMASQANAAAGAAAGRGRSWDLEDQLRRRQWELEDRAYEENWRLYDAGLSAGDDGGF